MPPTVPSPIAPTVAPTITLPPGTPTPTIFIFPGPAPVVISPFRPGYAQCSEGPGGALNTAVRLSVPVNAAPGASIYCRLLRNSYEVADPRVLEREVRLAVEIFAFSGTGSSVTRFGNSVRVCLQGQGAFWFLDVNGQPRTGAQLPAIIEDGFTCADIPNAGTVALTAR